jgi:DNA primase large subunit
VYQWCGFKSRRGKNKNLTALKSNSNTVWCNFQTYIYLFHFCFKAKLAEQNLSDRTNLLEMRENSTSLKLQQQTALLQQELTKMSNRGK